MRVTAKGQVTIPQRIREKAGLLPDTEVEFELRGGLVIIKRARLGGRESRGQALVRRMRGSATAKPRMTTDEIMALMRPR
jgi:AbrB family looped-hinge helix DNA binding protein